MHLAEKAADALAFQVLEADGVESLVLECAQRALVDRRRGIAPEMKHPVAERELAELARLITDQLIMN